MDIEAWKRKLEGGEPEEWCQIFVAQGDEESIGSATNSVICLSTNGITSGIQLSTP